ncbi:MAG: HupE/UreJ family protein [Gammaproteobacteria bacterium]
MKRNLIRLVTLPCALLFSGMVMAHTGHHDVSGFLSGLSHPFTGPDHLAAMLAVGLWAGINTRGQAWLPVTAFLVFMSCGAVLGMSGIAMSGVEAGIAASVLVTGLLVATLARLPTGAVIALVGVFALFHGSAHGAEMPSAVTPVLYGLGFLVSTVALHLGGIGLGRLAQRTRVEWLVRGAGVITGGFGAWLLLAT